MKTLKSQLPENAKQYFTKSTKAIINGYTVKYYLYDGKINFSIYKGKGNGCSIASSSNFDEVLVFTKSDYVYKTIYSLETGAIGGAYFFKGTEKMIFSNHPFLNGGYKF